MRRNGTATNEQAPNIQVRHLPGDTEVVPLGRLSADHGPLVLSFSPPVPFLDFCFQRYYTEFYNRDVYYR